MADDQQEAPEQVSGVPVPGTRSFATGFNLVGMGDLGIMLVASGPIAAQGPTGDLGIGLLPIAQLTMPWVSCKELAVLLQGQVELREKEIGTITSDWLAQQQAEKQGE